MYLAKQVKWWSRIQLLKCSQSSVLVGKEWFPDVLLIKWLNGTEHRA